jgi:hypothetical protein
MIGAARIAGQGSGEVVAARKKKGGTRRRAALVRQCRQCRRQAITL